MLSSRPVRLALMGMILVTQAVVCHALDTIYLRSAERPVGGTITAVTKTEITVDEPGRGDRTIPANDIRLIEWEGEPPVFKRARSEENSGQYGAALASYQEALDANPSSANVRADLQFHLASTTARLALTDPDQVEAAKTELQTFLTGQSNHYRFFDAQLLLGDVALASGDLPVADQAFNSVAGAPWQDYQMSGQIGLARVLLQRDDLAGARRAFDAVVSLSGDDEATQARRLEAMVGQAHILQIEQSYPEAIAILDQVIDESTAEDTRVQAEAYLRQGNCYQLMGNDPKEAIMAYLHVDVIPALARESEFHAEALHHLVQLWRQIGDTARATEANDRLNALYADSEWATQTP